MTDLPQLDLAYAPPFWPGKDPVVVNGFVNSNTVNENYNEISVEEVKEKLAGSNDTQLLDVRNFNEINRTGKIDDSAIVIDLDELRYNLNLLDINKETIERYERLFSFSNFDE